MSYSGIMLFNLLPAEFKMNNNFTVSSSKSNHKQFFLRINCKVDHLELFPCVPVNILLNAVVIVYRCLFQFR